MKNVIIAFLLAGVGMTAQVRETRSVGNFTQLQVSQGIELTYVVSNTVKITVETDSKELLKHIKTEVNGKALSVYIESQKGKWSKNNTLRFKILKVFVEGPDLDAVKVSSSAKFIAKDILKANGFALDVSSSGYFKGSVKAQTCKVNVSSSAEVKADIQAAASVDVRTSSSSDFVGVINTATLLLASSSSSGMVISGDVKRVQAELSSSSKIEAEKLKARELEVSASSSSSAYFYVSEKIDAAAASSASIKYFGNPKEVNVKNTSSGKVSKG